MDQNNFIFNIIVFVERSWKASSLTSTSKNGKEFVTKTLLLLIQSCYSLKDDTIAQFVEIQLFMN